MHLTDARLKRCEQASEPETFIPLQMMDPETRVVLAGDHKQLGVSAQFLVLLFVTHTVAAIAHRSF